MTKRDRFVKSVLDALDDSFTISNDEYIDALEEILSEVEMKLDAAKESADD